MLCKSKRKPIEEIKSTKVYIMGPVYSGKKYLCSHLTKNCQSSNFLRKPNYKMTKKQVQGRIYQFLIYEQGEEKYQIIIKHIRQADIVVLVYDLTDNEQIDYFTFWGQKLKENAKNSNVIFLGRKIDVARIAKGQASKKIEQILSDDVVKLIESQKWTQLQIANPSQQALDMIWDILLSKARIQELSSQAQTNATKNQINPEEPEEQNYCRIF